MITMESKLLCKGVIMTMEDFKTKYSLPDDNMTITMAELLIKQGKISESVSTTAEEDEIITAIKRNMSIETGEQIADENLSAQVLARETKNQTMTLQNIELDFANSLEANKFEDWCYNKGMYDTGVINRRGAISLSIENISPLEFSDISKKYNAEKYVKAVVSTTDKAVTFTTDTVNKLATDVVAPVATIAGKGVLNIGKGLAQTIIKTGTGLFNSGANAVRDTGTALKYDEDMIKAKRELAETRNGLMSWGRTKLDKRNRAGGSGIRVK